MSTSTIKGKVREQAEDFGKKIGMMEVSVIAINPSEKEYKDLLGIELKEDSKAATYLGESKDGNNYVRVDFWLQETKTEQKYKVSFFLEDKVRVNKDETKQQFINNIGICSWGADEDSLPTWFVKREYRNAMSGEEDFYSFIRSWLGGLDYRHEDTEMSLDWKQLMKGKVDSLKEQIDGDFSVPFITMATVTVKGEGEDLKEYQGIYNKAFLPSYTMRHFTLRDYSDPDTISTISSKENKDLKLHEKFIKNVSGEYGCKNIHSFRPLHDYISEEHLVASDDVMGGAGEHDSSEY